MTTESTKPTSISILISVLLAVATIAFGWGSFAERSVGHDVHSETSAISSPVGSVPAEGETSMEHAGESGARTSNRAAKSGQEVEFHPLGVNLESTPLVITAALVSFLLVFLVALRPRREVLAAVVVLGLAFAILEMVEVAHQLAQNRPGLVALAAIAGVLHATVAVLAAGKGHIGRNPFGVAKEG